VRVKKAHGAGGIAPSILNLSIRWSWAASFKSWSLYFCGKLPWAHWSESWVGSRAGLHIVDKPLALTGVKPNYLVKTGA